MRPWALVVLPVAQAMRNQAHVLRMAASIWPGEGFGRYAATALELAEALEKLAGVPPLLPQRHLHVVPPQRENEGQEG